MLRRMVGVGLVACALVLASSGCIHTPIAIAASTKPLDPNGYDIIGKVQETDCLWALLGILPVSTGNHLHGALEDAMRKARADALIQVSVETFYQHWIIISRHCVQVNGIAVRSRGTPQPQPPPLPPML